VSYLGDIRFWGRFPERVCYSEIPPWVERVCYPERFIWRYCFKQRRAV